MFIAEVLVLCLIFTLMVVALFRNPLDSVDDFPPEIGARCRELGLIKDREGSKKLFYIRKLIAMPVFGFILGLVVTWVNGATRYWECVMIAYALWFCVDWYDCLILDFCWATRSKRFIVPGTEDLIDSYRNKWWHVKMSLIGMVLGVPVALFAGLAPLVLR